MGTRRRDMKFPENGFEDWGGYMLAKISKLEEQYVANKESEEKLSDIFNGISIYVNGYTIPSSDELKSLMSKHGGVYHSYQRNEDYMIASNLPDTKVKNMSLAKVVRPEWITKSIEAGHLLDYRNFLLYDSLSNQKKITFPKVVNEKISEETSNSNKIFSCKEKSSTSPLDHNPCYQSAKTAADPNFISEFYNNSRLHHISQLGASFKQYINDLRDKSDFTFPARNQLKQQTCGLEIHSPPLKFDNDKVIMHIDMDCFFVSVGLRNRADLKGLPVAVTHAKGAQTSFQRSGMDRQKEFNLYKQRVAKKISENNGNLKEDVIFESRVDNISNEGSKFGSMSEIASCSYEARAKGIHNGMFLGAAIKLCPDLRTIPYDFDDYKDVAYTLYNTIAQYTLDIEAVSCDEMYVDCTEILESLDISVQDFATALRNEIKTKTECPCSCGFGGNRLQARLATKKAKPNGQYFVTSENVNSLMIDTSLKDLPGVGRHIARKLESLGYDTCGSLQSATMEFLQQHFGGKTGAQLYSQCRGKDDTPLSFYTERKSISAEVNYGIRFNDDVQVMEFLKQLCGEVHSRLTALKCCGKIITLKLMVRAKDARQETAKFLGHGFCDNITKSSNLIVETDDVDQIIREVISLYKKQNINPKELRGVGIQITKLQPKKSKKPSGHIKKFFVDCKSTGIATDKVGSSNGTFKTTYDKRSPLSTPKKNRSPSKKVLRSPQGRKRGRPPKISLLYSAKNSVDKYFKPNIENIVKKETENSSVKTEVSIVCERVPIDTSELDGLCWNRVKELLRAWLDSGQTPLSCDIKSVSTYLSNMVINKDLEHLYILVRFLRRRTNELNCEEWKNGFQYVIDQVQNAMIAVYGNKLYVPD